MSSFEATVQGKYALKFNLNKLLITFSVEVPLNHNSISNATQTDENIEVFHRTFSFGINIFPLDVTTFLTRSSPQW